MTTNMENKKCPICGTGTLSKVVKDEQFEYKGQSITVPDYIVYACDACEEEIVDKLTLKHSGKILNDFKRRAEGLLTGEEIKQVRIKLGLKQQEMAEILGGGLKAFARYESGTVCQSRAMDNLLRILNEHPETLQVLKKRMGSKSLRITNTKVVSMEDFRSYRGDYVSKAKQKAYSLQGREFEYGT